VIELGEATLLPGLIDAHTHITGGDPRDYYELVPTDPFYRVIFADGQKFDYVGDEERLIAQIAAISPRDVEGYRRLVKKAQEIFEVGYVGLADKPFSNFGDMVRIVPELVRLGAWRSVWSVTSSRRRTCLTPGN